MQQKKRLLPIIFLCLLLISGICIAQEGRSFEDLEKAAHDGDLQAQTEIGAMYLAGDGVDQSYTKACGWLEKTSVNGSLESQAIIGTICYFGGIGFHQNKVLAYIWSRIAENTSGKGTLSGTWPQTSHFTEKEIRDAEFLVSQWHPGKQIVYGSTDAQSTLPNESFESIQKQALHGDAKAQFKLGIIYSLGIGISLDKDKAIEWVEKSANQGLAEAQSQLAEWYHEGNGVQQDYIKSLKWTQKAADQGLARAYHGLSLMYGKGLAVQKNLNKAFKLAEKAFNLGYRPSQAILGIFYYAGEFVPQNYKKAFELIENAAIYGENASMGILGTMYFDGLAVKQDKVLGYTWLVLAARANDLKAKTEAMEYKKQISDEEMREIRELISQWSPGKNIYRKKPY